MLGCAASMGEGLKQASRRAVLAALSGAALAWPRDAGAQQAMPRVGVLMYGAPEDGQIFLTAFETGLHALGRQEGVNLALDVRWAAGKPEAFHSAAVELLALKPDVVLATASAVVAALRNLTRTTPIVFANVSDPVGQGFVESLAHPGGNVSGFTNYEPAMSGKWLALLKEIAPQVAHVAIMFNPDVAPQALLFLRAIAAAAQTIGVTTVTAQVHDDSEITGTIALFARSHQGGLVVLADLFTGMHMPQIIDAAARYRLPAVYPYAAFVRSGGLVGYGIDNLEAFRGAAGYVDRILKGAKPSDLPVQEPTKFTLAVNLKTAKALGLTVPQTLLATADEVIE
jgi:putative ABC transport system substrate-binding protein